MPADNIFTSDTIAALYDAALDSTLWPVALEKLRVFTDTWAVHLHMWDKRSARVPFSLLVGPTNPEAEAAYVAYYGAIDPRVQLLETMKPGELLVCHEHFDDRYVAKSEFYQDYYFPKARGRYVAGTKFADNSELAAIIGLHRDSVSRPFTETDKARLRLMLPHLTRAARIHHQLDSLQAERTALSAALDKMPAGILLVDGNSIIVLANLAAEVILRKADGLRSLKGRLCARSAEDDRALQLVLRTSGHIVISRESDGPLHCLVAPLSPDSAKLFGLARPLWLVLISDPRSAVRSSDRIIAKAFGLTRAEGRVAAAIADGKSLGEIADEFGVTINTVRNQVRQVLSKSGSGRQAELVRLIHGLSALRDGVGGGDAE